MAGVGFYNIASGEQVEAPTAPMIFAFLNSSDMGLNATRGQDFKWRLSPEWVKKLKAFRANQNSMEKLGNKLDGGMAEIKDHQILFEIYRQQLDKETMGTKANSTPFEEEYHRLINEKPASKK